jgi:hypothetical protein
VTEARAGDFRPRRERATEEKPSPFVLFDSYPTVSEVNMIAI